MRFMRQISVTPLSVVYKMKTKLHNYKFSQWQFYITLQKILEHAERCDLLGSLQNYINQVEEHI